MKHTLLWLDDERPAPGPEWTHVVTARAAVACLDSCCVTRVSLDHDLGPPENGTGYDVLLWLEERVSSDHTFVVPHINVHSANPPGAARMRAAVDSINRIASARKEHAGAQDTQHDD